MITLRRMTSTDFEDVVRLNAAASPAVTSIDVTDLHDRTLHRGYHLVAVRAGEIVGYLLSFHSDDPDYDGEEFRHFIKIISAPFLYIAQIVVTPERQNEGIGRSLYTACFTEARRLETDFVCCEVNTRPANPDSMRFHQRLQFSQIDERSISDGRSVALFTLRLPSKTASA